MIWNASNSLKPQQKALFWEPRSKDSLAPKKRGKVLVGRKLKRFEYFSRQTKKRVLLRHWIMSASFDDTWLDTLSSGLRTAPLSRQYAFVRINHYPTSLSGKGRQKVWVNEWENIPPTQNGTLPFYPKPRGLTEPNLNSKYFSNYNVLGTK